MRRPAKNSLGFRETKNQLKSLYREYKRLNTDKSNYNRLQFLIDTISRLEYKFINQLKERQNFKNLKWKSLNKNNNNLV